MNISSTALPPPPGDNQTQPAHAVVVSHQVDRNTQTPLLQRVCDLAVPFKNREETLWSICETAVKIRQTHTSTTTRESDEKRNVVACVYTVRVHTVRVLCVSCGKVRKILTANCNKHKYVTAKR